MFWDILMDSVWDTLNLVPFLFVAYFILEYIEHNSEGKMISVITKSHKFGPLWGSLLGLFPHCGFSAMASSFYATRVITLGTLFAVYLSTSDEMLPIFLSEGVSAVLIFQVLLVKFIVGMVFGFVIDFLFRQRHIQKDFKIHEFCDCSNCCCSDGIFYPAIKHTVKISLWIFLITLMLSLGIGFIGEDKLMFLFSGNVFLTSCVATLVGLIPNCASSVVLSKLYIENIITLPSLVSGLLVGAGLGLIVLFKMNRNLKENFAILLGLYVIAVLSSAILQMLGF